MDCLFVTLVMLLILSCWVAVIVLHGWGLFGLFGVDVDLGCCCFDIVVGIWMLLVAILLVVNSVGFAVLIVVLVDGGFLFYG